MLRKASTVFRSASESNCAFFTSTPLKRVEEAAERSTALGDVNSTVSIQSIRSERRTFLIIYGAIGTDSKSPPIRPAGFRTSHMHRLPLSAPSRLKLSAGSIIGVRTATRPRPSSREDHLWCTVVVLSRVASGRSAYASKSTGRSPRDHPDDWMRRATSGHCWRDLAAGR